MAISQATIGTVSHHIITVTVSSGRGRGWSVDGGLILVNYTKGRGVGKTTTITLKHQQNYWQGCGTITNDINGESTLHGCSTVSKATTIQMAKNCPES